MRGFNFWGDLLKARILSRAELHIEDALWVRGASSSSVDGTFGLHNVSTQVVPRKYPKITKVG